MIADAVLIRLSSLDLAHALAGRGSAGEQSAALADQIATDSDQMEELATKYGTKDITAKDRPVCNPTGGSDLDCWRAARAARAASASQPAH